VQQVPLPEVLTLDDGLLQGLCTRIQSKGRSRMNEAELKRVIEDAMLTVLNAQTGPVRFLSQHHFGHIVDAVMLKYYGKRIDTGLMGRMVAERLAIINDY